MDLVWILIEADLEKRVSVQKYFGGGARNTSRDKGKYNREKRDIQ